MPTLAFKVEGKLCNPRMGIQSWIAPNAWVIGDAEIGRNCTILFGAVVRGDVLSIKVGDRTNIQDGALLHTSTGLSPTIIGSRVTIGHHAIVHGATVGDDCLIGMGAIILDGVEIGAGSIIGANALVTKGVKIPPRSLVLGSPAKLVRTVTDAEFAENRVSADHYVEKATQYHSLCP